MARSLRQGLPLCSWSKDSTLQLGPRACTLVTQAGAALGILIAETCADLQRDIGDCLYRGGGWEILIFQNKLFGLLARSLVCEIKPALRMLLPFSAFRARSSKSCGFRNIDLGPCVLMLKRLPQVVWYLHHWQPCCPGRFGMNLDVHPDPRHPCSTLPHTLTSLKARRGDCVSTTSSRPMM